MNKPESIRQSETIIYACIVASALVSLINRWIGAIGPGEFGFQLIFYGLVCMIPYKLGRRSNPARYVYVVVSAINVLLMMGGGFTVPKLELILSVVLIPVEVYVSWTLFQPATSRWFTGEGDDEEKTAWYISSERREPK